MKKRCNKNCKSENFECCLLENDFDFKLFEYFIYWMNTHVTCLKLEKVVLGSSIASCIFFSDHLSQLVNYLAYFLSVRLLCFRHNLKQLNFIRRAIICSFFLTESYYE